MPVITDPLPVQYKDRRLCQGDNGTFPASWTAKLLARFRGESDEHRTTILAPPVFEVRR
jgi:hypothetical protein